jgi:hypothetical protein
MNKITCGANDQSGDYAGKSVGDLRNELKDVLNIPDESTAMINGEEVDDARVLTGDESLEFVKAAGGKG